MRVQQVHERLRRRGPGQQRLCRHPAFNLTGSARFHVARLLGKSRRSTCFNPNSLKVGQYLQPAGASRACRQQALRSRARPGRSMQTAPGHQRRPRP